MLKQVETVLDPRFIKKGKYKEIKNGSVVCPENAGLMFIPSLVSLSGDVKDSEVIKQFDYKWPKVRTSAKAWFAEHRNYKLGEIEILAVQSDIQIVHLLCLDKDNKEDVEAVKKCAEKLSKQAVFDKASLHLSKLFLSKLPSFSSLIENLFINKGVSVYVYP